MKTATQTLTDLIASQSEVTSPHLTLIDDDMSTQYEAAPSGARLLHQQLHKAAVESFFRRAS